MDRLLGAAAAEFSENGFAGATTAAIARRAETTEAQLFRYFPSKADLFREAVFKPMSEHIGQFSRSALGSGWDDGTDETRARHYIAELRSFLREHSRLLMSLLVARAYGNAPHAGAGVNSLDRYFERGAASRPSRSASVAAVPPALTVRVSFAALLACVLLDDWLFPDGLATRQEIDEAIEAFIVSGISFAGTPKARPAKG